MTIKIPDSLTQIVKDRIREMIIRGEFSFGQQLAENKLSTLFGVSKTPIREALVQLKDEGLVEVKARCGTFVYNPDPDTLQKIIATRAIIEVGALKLAYEENSMQLIHTLGKIIAHMDQDYDSLNYSIYLQLDMEFHNTIMNFANNIYLTCVYEVIANKIRALRHRLKYDAAFLARSTHGHINIYTALRTNNLDEACALLHNHISRVFQHVDLGPLKTSRAS